MAGDQIYALFQDRAGVIWVGMNDHGVDHSIRSSVLSTTCRTTRPPDSLQDNNILSITVGRSGTPWIGTRGGLERYDREACVHALQEYSGRYPAASATTRHRCSWRIPKGTCGSGW
ncbi:MAG: hypothetical protein IPI01_10395 [Ignavibacteriae bacterium]|nr:hypothetical protein [Ignavibacteriota bacterium]